MKLSILDQAPVTIGNTAADAFVKAEELAILGDQLGYHRFWMAEHHGAKTIASSAPEIAAAYLAGKTEHIRLGTGGVMMMHYSPLKMAEVFKVLSAFAPGRIDFGVGRAPGGDQYSVYALSQGKQPDISNMYGRLETTLQLLNDETPKDILYSKTIASPENIVLPEPWLLGSTGNSALEAGERGVGYSFAQFFGGELTKEILDIYKNNFKASVFMEKPKINVSYMVTTAETKEEAEFEAKPQDLWRLEFSRGKIIPYLTPEEAQDYPLTELDKMIIEENRKVHVVGDIKTVSQKLLDDNEKYGFDESMIVSIPHSQEKRLDVYRLLAKELL